MRVRMRVPVHASPDRRREERGEEKRERQKESKKHPCQPDLVIFDRVVVSSVSFYSEREEGGIGADRFI